MEREGIVVIGMSGEEVSRELLRILKTSFALIVCTEKTRVSLEREIGNSLESRWISFVPLDESLDRIRNTSSRGTVIIVTSGDPLFFGFGSTLLKKLPDCKTRFVPSVSSMQLCFSRFSIPWEQAAFLSLHGRPLEELYSYLDEKLLFILTDDKNSPSRIAVKLLEILERERQKQYTVMVGEQLGFSDEKLFRGTLAETADKCFRSPNCMILKKNPAVMSAPVRLGLKETQIRHSRGLITKDEIRAAVLHRLSLPEKGVFWDIGAGSGSISIEASRLNPGLRIFSIERKSEEIENIRHNIHEYGCNNIKVLQGTAPDILAKIPAPDRVFIGGSGGKMGEILDYVDTNTACGKVVITAVTEKTARETPILLLKRNFIVHKSVISVSRCTLTPGMDSCIEKEKLNAIHVISGEKKNDEKED